MPSDLFVIMLDAAERLESMEDWLRDEYLPSLPAETIVVIAGRRPPGSAGSLPAQCLSTFGATGKSSVRTGLQVSAR